MSKFLAEATPEYEKLKKAHDDMQVAFKDTVTFYAEDASKAQSEEFFGLINDFLVRFKKTHKELKDWQEKEKKPTIQPSRILHNQNPNSQGLVDELTANLRSGDAFKLRRQQQTAGKTVPGTPVVAISPATADTKQIPFMEAKQTAVVETKQIPVTETKEPKISTGFIVPSVPIKPSNMRSASLDSDITSKSEQSAPTSEGIPNTVPIGLKSPPPMGFKLPDPSIKKR